MGRRNLEAARMRSLTMEVADPSCGRRVADIGDGIVKRAFVYVEHMYVLYHSPQEYHTEH